MSISSLFCRFCTFFFSLRVFCCDCWFGAAPNSNQIPFRIPKLLSLSRYLSSSFSPKLPCLFSVPCFLHRILPSWKQKVAGTKLSTSEQKTSCFYTKIFLCFYSAWC